MRPDAAQAHNCLSAERERARRALGQQRASRVPRPAAHLQPAPARTRPAHLRRSLQPPSAASGACTSSTRAGGRKPETPPSATLPAAKPPGSARRPDPRIQTRSLRPTSLRTHDLRSSSARQLTQAPTCYLVHARARLSDPAGRRQILAGQSVSVLSRFAWRLECARFEPTSHGALPEFLNPTGMARTPACGLLRLIRSRAAGCERSRAPLVEGEHDLTELATAFCQLVDHRRSWRW
jgi:hypothetical protein